jgi:hypothetical protein
MNLHITIRDHHSTTTPRFTIHTRLSRVWYLFDYATADTITRLYHTMLPMSTAATHLRKGVDIHLVME